MVFAAFAVLLSACEPIDNSESPKNNPWGPEDLRFTVENTSPGSNEIRMTSQMPGVVVQWDYMTGVTTADELTVIFPATGEIPIKFTAVGPNGQVSKTVTATITEMTEPIDPIWNLFAGYSLDEPKTWVWDATANGGNVWGTAGHLASTAPGWSVAKVGDTLGTGGYVDPNASFSMGLLATISVTDNGATRNGTYSFDMSKKTPNTDNGEPWSDGQLTLAGLTMPTGVICWAGTPVSTYNIIKLTETEMVLEAAPTGAGGWAEGTFWMFKAKE